MVSLDFNERVSINHWLMDDTIDNLYVKLLKEVLEEVTSKVLAGKKVEMLIYAVFMLYVIKFEVIYGLLGTDLSSDHLLTLVVALIAFLLNF